MVEIPVSRAQQLRDRGRIDLEQTDASDADIADVLVDAAVAARDDGRVTVLDFAEGPGAVIAPLPGSSTPGHDHQWHILGAQPAPPPGLMFGKPVPRTAVLATCTTCGLPTAWLIDGTWTQAQLTGIAGSSRAPSEPR